MANTPIYGTLDARQKDGRAVRASQSYDEHFKEMQSELNLRFEAGAAALGERVDELSEAQADADGLLTRVVSDVQTQGRKIDELEGELFPLTVSFASSSAGKYEAHSTVVPRVTLKAVRRGEDVSGAARVGFLSLSADGSVTSGDGATMSGVTPTVSGLSVVFPDGITCDGEGAFRFEVSVSQGGQTKRLSTASWQFGYYRYRGVCAGWRDGLEDTQIIRLIQGLGTRELCAGASLPSTDVAAGAVYLFAVAGAHNLVCRHAVTGGVITGCSRGVVSVPLLGDSAVSVPYSYIAVPGGDTAWKLEIKED